MRPILSRTQHNKKLKRREATKMFKPGVNGFLMRSIHSVWQIQLSVFFTFTDSFSKNIFPALQCIQHFCIVFIFKLSRKTQHDLL